MVNLMLEDPSHQLFAGLEGPRNTRERILFVAMDLFYAEGFHAVGLDSILAKAELTKTTFYNHFESRDELVLETIRLRDAWESDAFMRAVRDKAGYEPRALMLACFDVLDEWFTHPEFRGCLFMHACAEFPSPSDPAHRAAAEHYAVSEETVAKMAAAAGVADAESFAKEWVLLIEGAITHRMVAGHDGSARVARRIAERILAEATAAG